MGTHRTQPANRHRRGRLSGAIVALCFLLAVPGYALSRPTPHLDWRILVGAPVALSVLAFLAYGSDKRRAEAEKRRVPEATLHVVALLGGWPGAFLAQQAFRHKTSKLSFQFVFWIIVLLHQLVAVDSLLDWRMAKNAIHAITPNH